MSSTLAPTSSSSTPTKTTSTEAIIVKNNLIELNKNTSAPDALISDEPIITEPDYEYDDDYEFVETGESATKDKVRRSTDEKIWGKMIPDALIPDGPIITQPDYEFDDDYEFFESGESVTKDKVRRSTDEKIWGKMIPGACMKGCAAGFFTFAIVSSVINCFGASGRIGNLLVNYRCVSTQDKSITQGLALMLVSLFALIPGPILYGRLIDSTCLVWTEKCSGSRGNCQLYDQRAFRYIINLTALSLTTIGVFFDVLVWKFGKNLDLYGEREAVVLQQKSRNGFNNQNHS